jgi:hypothetical protein
MVQRLAWSDLAAQSAEQVALAATPLIAVRAFGAQEGATGALQTEQTQPFLLVVSMPAGVLVDRMSPARLCLSANRGPHVQALNAFDFSVGRNVSSNDDIDAAMRQSARAGATIVKAALPLAVLRQIRRLSSRLERAGAGPDGVRIIRGKTTGAGSGPTGRTKRSHHQSDLESCARTLCTPWLCRCQHRPDCAKGRLRQGCVLSSLQFKERSVRSGAGRCSGATGGAGGATGAASSGGSTSTRSGQKHPRLPRGCDRPGRAANSAGRWACGARLEALARDRREILC